MTKDEVYRKLDDKIKDLKSTRVYKKITPKGDLSWYIKWVSSVFIIVGMALTSANIFPVNIIVHGIGVTGWLIVGMLWHDRALIFLNAVAIFVYASGLLNHYFGG
jgi:hypothetical protein|tara:strand:- start:289 stop:603 length:315 start_codon:yes stop_codon:yes gene_type:complete